MEDSPGRESGLVLSEEGNPAGLSSCSGGLRPLVELCAQLSLATRGEDWASQGQPQGKAEIPVVHREIEFSVILPSRT